jgi:hypothetical protein
MIRLDEEEEERDALRSMSKSERRKDDTVCILSITKIRSGTMTERGQDKEVLEKLVVTDMVPTVPHFE